MWVDVAGATECGIFFSSFNMDLPMTMTYRKSDPSSFEYYENVLARLAAESASGETRMIESSSFLAHLFGAGDASHDKIDLMIGQFRGLNADQSEYFMKRWANFVRKCYNMTPRRPVRALVGLHPTLKNVLFAYAIRYPVLFPETFVVEKGTTYLDLKELGIPPCPTILAFQVVLPKSSDDAREPLVVIPEVREKID